MNKKYALYILIGMVIGAIFGIAFGPALNNTSLATAVGAIVGLFIGWFIAAANTEMNASGTESTKGKKPSKKEVFFFSMIVFIAILVSSMIIFQPEWLF